MQPSSIGHRIHVIGSSCSGKSSLAERLARGLAVPLVELDALNWEPNWVGLSTAEPDEFERRLRAATAGDAWVVAGSYARFSERVFWPRLETVIWLDLPLPLLLVRALTRSWRRWRSRELLWGTNYERFWSQFMVWRKDRVVAVVDRDAASSEASSDDRAHGDAGVGAHPVRSARVVGGGRAVRSGAPDRWRPSRGSGRRGSRARRTAVALAGPYAGRPIGLA